MNLHVISCEIFFREICWAAAKSPHRMDLHFLPKGLHDLPSDDMRSRVQAAVDAAVEPDTDAVVMGFGLCNNGLVGVRAKHCPLVLPRAHDCITLFFGSKERYREYFFEHPGTYFYTSGWIERGGVDDELKDQTIMHRNGLAMSYDEMVREYGEDNAEYLRNLLGGGAEHHYDRILFIETGIEPNDSFQREARRRAAERAWEYLEEKGDLRLLRRLLDGDWDDEDFLVVPPGKTVAAAHDEHVVKAV